MTLMRCLVESESWRGYATGVRGDGSSVNGWRACVPVCLELVCKNGRANLQHGDKKEAKGTKGRAREAQEQPNHDEVLAAAMTAWPW